MNHHAELCAPQARPIASAPSALFSWSGGGIVLLGERVDARWVLARGWHQSDRLGDVRRWSFADRLAFAGQVRRLVRDATNDLAAAAVASTDAARWAETSSHPAADDRDRGLVAHGS